MTHEPMKNLKEFHDTFHHKGANRDYHNISTEDIVRRSRLIQEESIEVSDSLVSYIFSLEFGPPIDIAYNREQVAKELADLLYVVYGTAEELGFQLEDIFARVHKSNMSKVWDDGTVHYNEFGKVLKPPTYSPPDLSDLI